MVLVVAQTAISALVENVVHSSATVVLEAHTAARDASLSLEHAIKA